MTIFIIHDYLSGTAVVFWPAMLFILWTLRKDDKNQKRLNEAKVEEGFFLDLSSAFCYCMRKAEERRRT